MSFTRHVREIWGPLITLSIIRKFAPANPDTALGRCDFRGAHPGARFHHGDPPRSDVRRSTTKKAPGCIDRRRHRRQRRPRWRVPWSDRSAISRVVVTSSTWQFPRCRAAIDGACEFSTRLTVGSRNAVGDGTRRFQDSTGYVH